jgi:hypothetical protein
MNDNGNPSPYLKYITEARKYFEREDREKACQLYAQANLHHQPDADIRDLGDFLVVATEYRPELASEIARLILSKPIAIPPLYLQDVFFCALTLPDRPLEEDATRLVLSGKPDPGLCIRIADIYFEHGPDRRDQVKAVMWVNRAAEADAVTFGDWAAKAYALHLLVANDTKAKLAVLGCAQKALELAETDHYIDTDALEDLLEALAFLEYEGSLIAKFLYEKLLANNNIALPAKHRIWQDLRELQGLLKL